MIITSKSYSGIYGTQQEIGDIIHVNVTSPYAPITDPIQNEIMFLIDVSASMEDSMAMVKSSLLAFRDTILDRSPQEMEELTAEDRDILLREKIKLRLITFSNTAEEVWSFDADPDVYFEDVVIGLRTIAMTNMGDALKVAFEKTDPDLFSWIVVMTDGESNEGPCRTADAFQRLVSSTKPLNTKIITLGYGNRFQPEVLDKVGDFVYVENKEMIPVVLGNIVEDIMTVTGFNCVVEIEGVPLIDELDEDTIIVPAGETEAFIGKEIVGNRLLSTISMGENYDYVYLPHGNNILTSLTDYKRVNIRYTDIHTKEIMEQVVEIEHTKLDPPDEVKDLYFNAEKKRLIYKLYLLLNSRSRNMDQHIKRIQKQIENWEDPISYPHKDQINKLIQDMGTDTLIHRTSTALNFAIGTGYTDSTRDSRYLDTTLTATTHYMESPLINNN